MSVGNLVQYFEDLNLPMESKRVRLSRNGTSKSMHEKPSSKVKKFLTDITELKRPAAKNKTSDESSSEKSSTLPRYFKNENTHTNYKKNVKSKVTSNKKKVSNNLSSSADTKKISSALCSDIESFQQKIQNLSEHTQEIQKKVEDFGQNLRQKRQQSESRQCEENSLPSLPQHSYSAETQVLEKSHPPTFDIEDEGESSDDMFGYNNFEENEDDNYIIETYNKEGHELVITTLLITRRTIAHNNEIDENINTLIHNSDYVFHKSEYESKDSKNEKEEENVEIIETKEIEGHSHVFDNNYFQDSTELEEEVFYDEVVSEPYMSTYANYEVHNDSNTTEGNEPFYENINNFSCCDEVIINSKDEITPSKINLLHTNSGKLTKIQYVIEEMIKTEELYICGINFVITNYIPFVYDHSPQDLIGRTAYLFGNIEKIYDNAKKFLTLMKNNCDSPDSIAQVFIDSAAEFELYPLYSKNKPTADLYLKQFDPVIKDRQTQLNDKLGLASYLLTPIQRLGKYVLLLEQIQKELKKENKPLEKIAAAISVVRNVMRKGNDYIAIDSIKNSEIDLTSKGPFIMRAVFNIVKPRKFISTVFLFENIIVFTEKISRNSEQFKYVDSIAMSDLSLGKFEEKLNIFHLTNYSKSKKLHPDATYILEAETPKVKTEWTERIEKILWSQLQKAKEQQKKITVTEQKHTAKARTLSTSEVSLRKTRSHRTPTKSKSRFYDDQNT